MPYVQMNENESFEGGMRRFKRQVERAGLLTEMRMRMAYEKPTTRRKRLKIAAIKRLHRKLRMRSLPTRKY
ncbi:MAG: 30S ribosomal protein S21 [Gammaproteobacteria bacterium]